MLTESVVTRSVWMCGSYLASKQWNIIFAMKRLSMHAPYIDCCTLYYSGLMCMQQYGKLSTLILRMLIIIA